MGVDARTRSLNRVRAGQLRHVAIIERATQTVDELGDVIETWPEIAHLRCSMRGLTGQELFDAQKVKSRETHVIEMRHFDGLTASDRIDFNGTGRKLHIARPPQDPLEIGVLSQVFVFEETPP